MTPLEQQLLKLIQNSNKIEEIQAHDEHVARGLAKIIDDHVNLVIDQRVKSSARGSRP